MDFSKNAVLKENYSFFVGTTDGAITGGEHGLYNRDTRFLSRYEWTFAGETQTLLSYSPRPDRLTLHHAELDHHRQLVAYRRELVIGERALQDTLTVENPLSESKVVTLELALAADFADLFEARSWHRLEHEVTRELEENSVRFSYTASDGVEMSTQVTCAEPFEVRGDALVFRLELAPQSATTLTVEVQIHNPLETGAVNPISYDAWRKQFPLCLGESYQAVLNRAVDDLRALLLFDEHGTLPAAGIPWFVTAFGRDSLLTSYMMLPYASEVARGTLRYLAHYQALEEDAFRGAQPGKILHERRVGELTRTGQTPHSPYYGTVDATPLFVMLLAKVYEMEGDLTLVKELQSHWEAALTWMTDYGDLDGDGFLEYVGSAEGQALHVQSWKDSGDSMSHADGTLVWGATAVCEVQGYAFAAYRAAARFYQDLGETDKAAHWQEKAATLKAKFHEAFWLEDLQTYAMALDSDKQPLRVHSSDVGHLLWAGIVPDEVAPTLVKTLMGDETWSGWGIRTLGRSAARYNPVSYHNGSVWPHDTALVAGGLLRYGFKQEARQIATALFDLAATQADLRPAELVGGYSRKDNKASSNFAPPVPYPTACRPQAWSAAALIYLAHYL